MFDREEKRAWKIDVDHGEDREVCRQENKWRDRVNCYKEMGMLQSLDDARMWFNEKIYALLEICFYFFVQIVLGNGEFDAY